MLTLVVFRHLTGLELGLHPAEGPRTDMSQDFTWLHELCVETGEQGYNVHSNQSSGNDQWFKHNERSNRSNECAWSGLEMCCVPALNSARSAILHHSLRLGDGSICGHLHCHFVSSFGVYSSPLSLRLSIMFLTFDGEVSFTESLSDDGMGSCILINCTKSNVCIACLTL